MGSLGPSALPSLRPPKCRQWSWQSSLSSQGQVACWKYESSQLKLVCLGNLNQNRNSYIRLLPEKDRAERTGMTCFWYIWGDFSSMHVCRVEAIQHEHGRHDGRLHKKYRVHLRQGPRIPRECEECTPRCSQGALRSPSFEPQLCAKHFLVALVPALKSRTSSVTENMHGQVLSHIVTSCMHCFPSSILCL